ncbi:MAG: myo-inositol 2-dehydrogenase/D-chiro-inositol 1-dehydrogenase, partial [Candidatus Binatia bacterium]
RLTAMGDLLAEPMERSLASLIKQAPDKVQVESERRFTGFDAYRKVIDSGVDVVLLTTPPGFRPQHLKAAVDAGKHAFVEIVMAVDAPGVRSCLQSAELAREKNLAIVSGYCWRYNEKHRAVKRQIDDGALGEIRSLYATYLRATLSNKYKGPRKPEWTDLQWQLRNWYNYTWLSGDVNLVCSGGHSVDKMSWWLDDEMPIRAHATGGRHYPAEGNIFDHGHIVYEYASGIRGVLGCRNQDGCHNENADYITGTRGVCTIGRKPNPEIRGEVDWRFEGKANNMYQTEHDEFFASIRAGNPINDGKRMAHTTLMAIMGRMAAYTGQEITWEQALNSQEKLLPDEIDWDTKIEIPPLAQPGKTKFY